jgi:hypothetical protein
VFDSDTAAPTETVEVTFTVVPLRLTALTSPDMIALLTYTLAHLNAVLPRLYELFCVGIKSPLAVVVPTVVNVPVTLKFPPIHRSPETLAAPTT